MDLPLLVQIFILVNAVFLGVIVTLVVQHTRSHLLHKQELKQPQPADALSLDPALKQKILHDAETSFQNIVNRSMTSLETDLVATTDKLRSQLEKFGHDAESDEAAEYHKTISELQEQAKGILGSTQVAITTHQTEIAQKLNEKQAELEDELVSKIAQLEEELSKRQLELQTELNEHQAELESRLAKHHTELRMGFDERQKKIEAELMRHQTELASALKEREATLAKIQTEFDTNLIRRRQELEKTLQNELEKKRLFMSKQLDEKLSDAVSAFLLEALGHSVDIGAQGPYLLALLKEHKNELVKGLSDDERAA